MKKVLIFSHALEIGGAERALLGLLEAIDKKEYEVDLFLMRHQGELMKYIPEGINLLPENDKYASLAIPFAEVAKKLQMGMAMGRYNGKKAALKRIAALGITGDNDIELEYSHKYTCKYMPMVSDKEYDLAVSFLTPHYFVAEKVKAAKKIAWIHTDYSFMAIDKESQHDMWSVYDKIAAISDSAADSFIGVFPDLKDKVFVFQNIMPMKYMEALTNEFDVSEEMPDDGAIKLLSIGRYCTAKNFDSIPFICKEIIKQDKKVKWYIIGYGGDEELIKSKIVEAGMESAVIMLGKKENPYPYIKACDFYVQPSRYEGKCVSVIEAQILNKPVIITNYPTSKSQLDNYIDGVIVPLDNKKCAEGIINVINDEILTRKIVAGTRNKDYANRENVKLIYQEM